jgi:aconitate hydratase
MDLTREPLGYDQDDEPVYLKDIWPSPKEISAAIAKAVKPSSFKKRYGNVFNGDANWKKVKLVKGQTYQWEIGSTYVKNPPYFEGMGIKPAPVEDIKGARVLAVFGDSITTDHISPAGNIKATAPAGLYLLERQVAQKDFNSYGSRRGNHEVMERGTFANIRIRNEMMGGAEGGNTIYYATQDARGETMSIFDAAQAYKKSGQPMVVFGGKEYGTGSSRDWAAKGPKLLGVRAVITESFERIHRSNLIGMGVAPFCFEAGKTRKDYGITGREVVDIPGLSGDLKPRQLMGAIVHLPDGSTFNLPLRLMIMTADEVAYFKNGGILPYVLRNLLAA